MRLGTPLALLGVAVVLAGCGGSKRAQTTTAAAAAPSPRDREGVVWLCRPGVAPDPCRTSLDTTVIENSGARHIEHDAPAANPPIDCFYIYPTVTPQKTPNANLRIQPQERSVARIQAARFSQVCRVYAPIYRQVPIDRIVDRTVTSENAITAYAGVLKAFQDYLVHYNDGRGFVLIGHSQGAAALIALIRQHIDLRPSIRKRLVSAILLGGNVLEPNTPGGRGDFVHVRPCTSAQDTHCVVAYSSFTREPPANSYFGRTGEGLNPFGLRTPSTVVHVVCTNPAALGGGSAPLEAMLPVAAFSVVAGASPGRDITTPWVAYPGSLTARCESRDGATWLQIDPQNSYARTALTLAGAFLGARWGLHLIDVNVALGNLVALVRSESAAYLR